MHQITFSDFVVAMGSDDLVQSAAGVEFAFSLIDADHDGVLRSADFYLLNYLMGLDVQDCDIREVMKQYDDKLDLDCLKLMLMEGYL